MLTARDYSRLANDGLTHVSESTKRGAHETDSLIFKDRGAMRYDHRFTTGRAATM